MSVQDQVDALYRNWIWVKDWSDADPKPNGTGRLVAFSTPITLNTVPSTAVIHCTADTRYKLIINGERVCVGPSRSSPERWLYDEIDISPYLVKGRNVITFIVMRYFYATRAAMPFVRTGFPGLTAVGKVGEEDISTGNLDRWTAVIDEGTEFPQGLEDDVFLHINERRAISSSKRAEIMPYNLRLVNGELPPWRLHPRQIPLPEQSAVGISTIQALNSSLILPSWQDILSNSHPLTLPASTSHTLDILADCHCTAFTKWSFRSKTPTQIRLKVTYSEGYELEPRRYPWLRTKADRLDDTGLILGPFDEVRLDVDGDASYEPFWFRTFRLLRVEITCGEADVELVSLVATQTNYPLAVKASWEEERDKFSSDIFDISIRTMRNCMFDAYSDCPFYEQLSYSGDSRSVGLFHFLLSGDDRLVRQTILSFAGSITPEGLTQSRYPSQVQQVIAGFSLYWVLQICDHMLYFGDTTFTKSLLPLIDGVLNFFDRHIDSLGLVSGLPRDVWQYVDWVTGWHETDEHPSKGVPTAGRRSNRHTYFSMLYAWTLQHVAKLVRQVGRPQYAEEYEQRSDLLLSAIRKHCYNEELQLYTDSTSDVPPDTPTPFSQHVQVFAVLCGAAEKSDSARLLRKAFSPDTSLGRCSYVMMFYAFRAFEVAGMYEEMYENAWEPWRRMIRQNLSTWEEDDVRQRSDCHAWGSVPIYEYLSEVAGVQPMEPGFRSILFSPRTSLSHVLKAKVAVGVDNVASVTWDMREGGDKIIRLSLAKAVRVVSRSAGMDTDHGLIDHLQLPMAS